MATIGNVTFACDDPRGLAGFWETALDGYVREEPPPGLLEAIEAESGDANMADALVHAEDDGPRLYFRKMPKEPTDAIPIHLDLRTEDTSATVEALVDAGGRVVETKAERIGPYESEWTVMEDPEGNGFCVNGHPE